MAEGYLRYRLSGDRRGVLVESVGTLGIEGAPASVEALEAMREIGIDLGAHASRGATPERLAGADVIVVMTRGHLGELEARFRPATPHRYLLRAFEHGPEPRADAPDLDDPIGARLTVFREQRATIVRAVDHLALWLERLA
jgi:protein-tyrosine-phosphatase